MMNVLIDHLLYGIASRKVGGIRYGALDGGPLGENVSLEIVDGDEVTVVVDTTTEVFISTLTIISGETTEAQVVELINADATANKFIEAVKEDGEDDAVALLAEAANLVAQWGVLQRLIAEFNLDKWDDRELRTTNDMQALIYLGSVAPVRQGPIIHTFVGHGQAGITISNRIAFERQNVLLLQFERRLRRVLGRFVFTSPYGSPLTGINVEEGIFSNRTRLTKEESTGNVTQDSSLLLRAVVNFQIGWSQPADLNPDLSQVITGVNFGFWCVPITELPGNKELPTVKIGEFTVPEQD